MCCIHFVFLRAMKYKPPESNELSLLFDNSGSRDVRIRKALSAYLHHYIAHESSLLAVKYANINFKYYTFYLFITLLYFRS